MQPNYDIIRVGMEENLDVFYNKFIQIKTLILFVMSRLPHPIASDALAELTMCDDRISYFDFIECIQKLVDTKHLHLVDGKYALTAKGLRNSEILAEDLPHSVRENAKAAVERKSEAFKRDSLIKTGRTAIDNGGFLVTMSLSDGMGSILSVELLAGSEQQASLLEKGFRKKAQALYHEIVDLIMKTE